MLKPTEDQAISQQPFGMSISFLGLLFAVLASGCQSSDLPSNQRELTSQVYGRIYSILKKNLANYLLVCCSYQCLRMTNFVSQPTTNAMKTLLIIGNVLSYNMNPGVSYIILGTLLFPGAFVGSSSLILTNQIGMTQRMGLALGLHVESNRFSPSERHQRRHVW